MHREVRRPPAHAIGLPQTHRGYREMGHKKGVSASLCELGFVAYEQGDYDRAVRLHEQSLDLAREFGTTFGIAWSLRALADAVRGQGDLSRATTLLEEGLALSRSTENAWGRARTLASLGSVACESGEYTRASRSYEESLKLGQRMGLNHTILLCLEGLARVAVAQGRMERVARLCGTAAALREDIGWLLQPAKRAEHDRTVAAARAVLGEDTFAAACARGHALPLEEAIRDTLGHSVLEIGCYSRQHLRPEGGCRPISPAPLGILGLELLRRAPTPELLRTPYRRSSQNSSSTHSGE